MSYRSTADYVDLYSEIFLVIAGLLLFVGSSGVAKLFHAARNYGLEAPATPDNRFNRTPEGSTAAKPGELSGGAG